jgi:pheromone shutdown protein TraB
MEHSNKELSSIFDERMALNGRRIAFDIRKKFNAFWMRLLFGVNLEFNPFLPGVEVKYALEEANKLNSKVVFLGYEFDKKTVHRLHHENRNSILKALVNSWKLYGNTSYAIEMKEFRDQVHSYGIKKFLESSCDQYFVNWFIQIVAKVFPEIKRIMIEKKEEDIFTTVMSSRGKKTVLLVNQIHMEGIEHHWCHHFGQLPRNIRHIDIDPVGDMPLRNMLFSQMYHVIMRDVKTGRTKSTPASYSTNITPYWREFNYQYEHRNM